MICCRAPPPRGPYDPRLPRVDPGLGPGLEAVEGVVVADEVVGVVPGFLSEIFYIKLRSQLFKHNF